MNFYLWLKSLFVHTIHSPLGVAPYFRFSDSSNWSDEALGWHTADYPTEYIGQILVKSPTVVFVSCRFIAFPAI